MSRIAAHSLPKLHMVFLWGGGKLNVAPHAIILSPQEGVYMTLTGALHLLAAVALLVWAWKKGRGGGN